MPLNTIDSRYLQMSKSYGQRSTLSHSKRGCVLAKGNQILAIGINSHLDPAGTGSSHGGTENEKYIATINAEMVAVGSAVRSGLNIMGATMYSSEEPFWITFKFLVTMGIRRMVYYGPSKNDKIRDYGSKLGIEVLVVG